MVLKTLKSKITRDTHFCTQEAQAYWVIVHSVVSSSSFKCEVGLSVHMMLMSFCFSCRQMEHTEGPHGFVVTADKASVGDYLNHQLIGL